MRFTPLFPALLLITGFGIGCQSGSLPAKPSIPALGPEAKVVTTANNVFAFDNFLAISKESGIFA